MKPVCRSGARTVLVLAAVLGGAAGRGSGQKTPALAPLRAELTAPLDAGWAKAGTRVRARAVHEWAGPGCHLRANDMIEGHVSEVVRHSKVTAISTMHVVFDQADCDHHGMMATNLALVALIAPEGSDVPIGQAGLGKAPPVVDLPLSIDGAGAAPMRSVETTAEINQYAVTGDATRKDPEKMSLGQVIGMPGTKLQIAGGEGGSIVSAAGKDARLEGRTTLILLAVRRRAAVAPAGGSGSVGPGDR